MPGRFTIEADSLRKSFHSKKVFSGVGFSLSTGESLAVTGHNGSGKSTLLDIIAGIRKPDGGTLHISEAGRPVPPCELPERIGMAGPRVNPYRELTGEENLRFAAPGAGSEKIESLLGLFDLSRFRDKPAGELSSGMLQKLKIALAIAKEPPLLLLDEPGTSMDGRGKDELFRLLESLRGNALIVIATNDADEESFCSSRVSLA